MEKEKENKKSVQRKWILDVTIQNRTEGEVLTIWVGMEVSHKRYSHEIKVQTPPAF